MLRRIAFVLEQVAAIVVTATIVLLFTNSPTAAQPAPPAVVEAAGGIDGGALYGQSCAGCHGGDGSGGIGPPLAGRMIERFPNEDDQISVVTDGRRGMPVFSGRLSEEEIAAIVGYTRANLFRP